MPIYEYQCESCGHELEALQKMSDPLLKKCPECNKSKLKKKVSAAAFRLKGGGWYETDFKTGKKKNVAGDKSSPSSTSDSGSSGAGNDKSKASASKSKDTKTKSA
ncbi:MAG: zinc ribbon domain-containing protein [Cellvibrionaceae bacterium]